MPTRAGLLLLAVAVIGVLLLAAHGTGTPGPGSLTSLPRTVQPPFPDQGPAADVAAVRLVAQDALSAEVDAFAVRSSGAARLSPAARIAELARFETPTLASRAGYDSPIAPMAPYRSAAFRPVRWDGIAVGEATAKVYVIGHDVLVRPDGTVRRDAGWQYQLLLRRDARARNGWLVIAEAAAGGEQVSAVDAAPAAD